jgi:hypothetical protein
VYLDVAVQGFAGERQGVRQSPSFSQARVMRKRRDNPTMWSGPLAYLVLMLAIGLPGCKRKSVHDGKVQHIDFDEVTEKVQEVAGMAPDVGHDPKVLGKRWEKFDRREFHDFFFHHAYESCWVAAAADIDRFHFHRHLTVHFDSTRATAELLAPEQEPEGAWIARRRIELCIDRILAEEVTAKRLTLPKPGEGGTVTMSGWNVDYFGPPE